MKKNSKTRSPNDVIQELIETLFLFLAFWLGKVFKDVLQLPLHSPQIMTQTKIIRKKLSSPYHSVPSTPLTTD